MPIVRVTAIKGGWVTEGVPAWYGLVDMPEAGDDDARWLLLDPTKVAASSRC